MNTCPSGHTATIKLPTGKHRLTHVTVTVDGHKAKVTGSKLHPKVVVNLVNRPGSLVTIRILARQGRHAYRSVRHYMPCHVS